MPRQLKSFQVPSEISFEQDENRVFTLLRLKTSDRPGLLSKVGQAFASNKLRLHNARIATAGAEAHDTFAITDREDQPITDPEMLAVIAGSIKNVLDD
jgi:[protein-PII] uridylyltransferase